MYICIVRVTDKYNLSKSQRIAAQSLPAYKNSDWEFLWFFNVDRLIFLPETFR